MPVMVDFWPRPPERSYPALILEKLRPGDIHTHVYARQFPVVDNSGNVEPYMFEARQRGIWFDLGHGAASFWYRNGARAIANGFAPDSISTDLHMGNISGTVFSMQDTMSKCLAMGMTLEDVIYRSTATPAQCNRTTRIGHAISGCRGRRCSPRPRKGKLLISRLRLYADRYRSTPDLQAHNSQWTNHL